MTVDLTGLTLIISFAVEQAQADDALANGG